MEHGVSANEHQEILRNRNNMSKDKVTATVKQEHNNVEYREILRRGT